jgi:hypothetical protein
MIPHPLPPHNLVFSVAGLYVHVPFRRSEPPTDDAYTIGADATDVSRYKAALRRELTYYTQAYAADEQPTTIYVGGGRPSILPLSSLRALLPLADTVDLSAIDEATMDVHPADATPRYLHGLKHLGFTTSACRFTPSPPPRFRDLTPHIPSPRRSRPLGPLGRPASSFRSTYGSSVLPSRSARGRRPCTGPSR